MGPGQAQVRLRESSFLPRFPPDDVLKGTYLSPPLTVPYILSLVELPPSDVCTLRNFREPGAGQPGGYQAGDSQGLGDTSPACHLPTRTPSRAGSPVRACGPSSASGPVPDRGPPLSHHREYWILTCPLLPGAYISKN